MILNGGQEYFRLDELKLCSSDLKGKNFIKINSIYYINRLPLSPICKDDV